jgi:hypothetical protein
MTEVGFYFNTPMKVMLWVVLAFAFTAMAVLVHQKNVVGLLLVVAINAWIWAGTYKAWLEERR